MRPVKYARYLNSSWQLVPPTQAIHGPTQPRTSPVTVLNESAGRPCGVLKIGMRALARSSARKRRIGSFERAYADSSPPRCRMTVSKNDAYSFYTRIHASEPQGQHGEEKNMLEGTHRRHTEGGVSDDSERVVKFLIEAHEPHGVEGIYVREAPAMEAARRSPPSQGPHARR